MEKVGTPFFQKFWKPNPSPFLYKGGGGVQLWFFIHPKHSNNIKATVN